MPSTNTTNLNLEKPAEGEQAGSWGDTINANMDLIDAAVAIKDEDDMSSNSASHLSTQQSIKAYVDANAGANPAADNIVAGDSAINLTTTAGNITIDAQEDNSDIILKGTDGGADTTFLTIDGSDAGTASFNHDIKLASDSAKIDFGADGDITLQHIADNGLILKNNNTGDGSDVRLLMRTGEQAIEANDVIGIIQFQAPDDTDGDPDGHTICGSVAAVAEGNFTGSSNATKLVFKLGVSEVASEKMSLSSGGDLSVSNDVKLASDSAVLGFGDDNDVTLTHVADTGLLLNGTMQLQFNDASQNITAPSATVLDINATDEVEINATLADINANLDVSGTYTGGGTMTTGGNIVIPNAGNIGSVDDTDAIAISSSGLVTISQDVTVGDDINMTSDSAKIVFGVDGDVTLQHTADNGLILKNNNTGDGSDVRLLMRTGETAIEADDVVGLIQFQAPDDSDGDPDGHTVCASVSAVAEGNFTASSNATKLAFKTGASEAATEKMSLSSGGNLTLPTDGAVVNFGANSDVTLTHNHDEGLTLSAGANVTHFEITSTEDGTNAGPKLSLTRNSASPADGDDLGMIYFRGENDNDEQISYARIYAETVAVADGAESGRVRIQTYRAGTQTIVFMADDDEVELNGASIDLNGNVDIEDDLRVNNEDGSTYIIRGYNSGNQLNFYVRETGQFSTGADGYSPYNYTTSVAAQCNIASSGILRKSTSSLRFKKEVVDIADDWADKLLELKPIFFKSIAPADVDDNDPNWTYYGLGAEDVVKVDPRLVHLKTHEFSHNADTGENTKTKLDEPIAEGVQYDRMVPGLINIIKRLNKRVETLETKVAALGA